MTGHLDHTGYLIKNGCLIEDFYVIGGASTGEWAQHIMISVSWFEGSVLEVVTKAQMKTACFCPTPGTPASWILTPAGSGWVAGSPEVSHTSRQCFATE